MRRYALAVVFVVQAAGQRYVVPSVTDGTEDDVAHASSAAADVELLWPSDFTAREMVALPAGQPKEFYRDYLIAYFNLSSPCERCCVSECPRWPAGTHACRSLPRIPDQLLCLPLPVDVKHSCDRHQTWITCGKGAAVAGLWATGGAVCLATVLLRRWLPEPDGKVKMFIT